jgi:hypothetical protein
METISHKQRMKAFAMMDEMKDHVGYISLAHYYEAHKNRFSELMDYKDGKKFSLATDKCNLREYDVFMDYLTEEWFALGVQSDHSPIIYVDDVERYVGICLKMRICCISNAPNADVHHCKAIGLGHNRHKVDHSKYPRMSLSRKYHTECHTIGQQAFEEKYHLVGVYSKAWNGEKDVIDRHIAKGGELEDIENLLED